MTDIFIDGGRALLDGEFLETSLQIAGGEISTIGWDHGRGSFGLDARGLKVLPGIVDLHGDAFERQIMPRPDVDSVSGLSQASEAPLESSPRLADPDKPGQDGGRVEGGG